MKLFSGPGRIIIESLSLILISFSMAMANVNDIAVYPTGRINDTATPTISWNCTDDDKAKFTLSEGWNGHTIMDLEWAPIVRTDRAGRCSTRSWNTVGKKIIPPLKPWPPCKGKPGCVRVVSSPYGGLPAGKYILTVSLMSKDGNVQSYRSDFAIVENIYSDFSSDAAGWEVLRGAGNWTALGGQYNVRGNSRGEEWVSLYTGDVIIGRKGNKFYSGRHFQARLAPNCSNERCYAGIVLYNSYFGSSNGVDRYARSEVIISGDQKLSIRNVSDDAPGQYRAVLDRKDISDLISDKTVYTLDVYVSMTGKNGGIRVFIDKTLVFCGSNSNALDGNTGLVFSSNEGFESLDVDEFIVRPTPIGFHSCYWDLPYVPVNK